MIIFIVTFIGQTVTFADDRLADDRYCSMPKNLQINNVLWDALPTFHGGVIITGAIEANAPPDNSVTISYTTVCTLDHEYQLYIHGDSILNSRGYLESLERFQSSYAPTAIVDSVKTTLNITAQKIIKSYFGIKPEYYEPVGAPLTSHVVFDSNFLSNGLQEQFLYSSPYFTPGNPGPQRYEAMEITIDVEISFPNGIAFKSNRSVAEIIDIAYTPIVLTLNDHAAAINSVNLELQILNTGEPICTDVPFIITAPDIVDFGQILKKDAMEHAIYSENFTVSMTRFYLSNEHCNKELTTNIKINGSNLIDDDSYLDLDNGMRLKLKYDKNGYVEDILFGKEYEGGTIPEISVGSSDQYTILYNFIAEVDRIPGENIQEGDFEGSVIFTIEYQ